MIRIAFLIKNISNGGGTEKVTTVLSNSLVNCGYRVTIISCERAHNYRFHISDQIEVVSLQRVFESCGIARKFKNERKLYKIVKDRQVDIIVCVDAALYLYCFRLQRDKVCKCIAWEHFNYNISANLLGKISKRIAASVANCLVVLSKNDYEEYIRHTKRYNRIEYIYNPAELDFSQKADLNNKKIIAVGRLEAEKGFDRLISAWSIIEQKLSEWEVEIFGEGSLKNQLQSKIENCGLKRIHLMGYANDVKQKMLAASVYVMTSLNEGFGLVIIEALSVGLPVISFDCVGPSEIIRNQYNGLLIENGNIKELAENIELLARDIEKRKALALNSRVGLEKYDVNIVTGKWIDLFENLIT